MKNRSIDKAFPSYQEELKDYLNSGVTAVSSLIVDSSGKREKYIMGTEDDISQKSIDENTLFDIASITKLFTTTIILRLMEAGEIGLDNRVGEFLNNFKDSNIKLVDVLTHRVKFDLMLSEYRSKFPNDFREKLLQIKSPSEPAVSVDYHNLGYIYLGFIIEQVVGKTLDQVFQDLFRELGLQSTTTGAQTDGFKFVASERTIGKLKKGITQDESAELLGGIAGNAGVFSTAEDLAKFAQMWSERSIFSQDTQDRVFKNYGGESSQAIGWWGRTYSGNTSDQGVYCHPGFSGCLVTINRNNGKAGVLLSNRTYFSRENKAHRMIFDSLIEELK